MHFETASGAGGGAGRVVVEPPAVGKGRGGARHDEEVPREMSARFAILRVSKTFVSRSCDDVENLVISFSSVGEGEQCFFTM